MLRRELFLVLPSGALLAACDNQVPDASSDGNDLVRQHLVGTWLREYSDEGAEVRRVMTLEQAIDYIDDDEMVEVTPKSIRIRKALLCPHERKKAGRKKEAA